MSRRKKTRKIIENGSPLEEMKERFQNLLAAGEWQLVLDEIQKPLYQAVRLNPLKNKQTLNEIARLYHWQTAPVPYCDQAAWITDSPQAISKTPEHQLGHYYIQDAASMLPVELFDFDGVKNPLVLDMAASPGGKTTHLLAKTQDSGLVIANDSSRDRLTALRIVLQNWGAAHIAVTNYPGEKFGAWFPEIFDRILLDAPCSMQGLRATESHPLRGITQNEINALAKRQSKLLSSAIQALKIGGQVVYSTCTLTPEENEGVLQSMLDLYGSAIRIDPFHDKLPASAQGLVSFQEKPFDPQVHNAARLWPHVFGTAGFFAARITKMDGIQGKTYDAPARPLSDAGWFALPPQEQDSVTREISQTYGFDFSELLQSQEWVLWSYKQTLHCFPQQFLTYFPELPVQALGLNLGERTPEGFEVSHEFVSRFGNLAQTNTYTLDEVQSLLWMQGEDLTLTMPNNTDGLLIIRDHRQRLVGRGKYAQDRLRNLLPHRYRLL